MGLEKLFSCKLLKIKLLKICSSFICSFTYLVQINVKCISFSITCTGVKVRNAYHLINQLKICDNFIEHL